MAKQILLILAIAFASSLTQASVQSSDWLVIADPNISIDDALSSAVAKSSSMLRGRRRKNPSAKNRLKMHDKIEVNNQMQDRQRSITQVSDLEEEDRAALLAIPGVLSVIPNSPIELAILNTGEIDNTNAKRVLDAIDAAADQPTTQWNLDRVDQAFGRDLLYTPAQEIGTGIDLYIIDTGVQANHVAFGGRVLPGFSAVNFNGTADTDCNSHGTHVAGTAAGDVYGVARGATIIPVQVLDCDGRGSMMSLSQGITWAHDTIVARGNSKRAVVNLSIQAGGNDLIDDLVRSLYTAGAVVVVAAANFNGDACNYSPAREPTAVTVGASSDDDSKLSSSNLGKCVDLFAPGDNIVSASNLDRTGSTTKRGTSMASPLVAGIVATIRDRFPSFTNAQVISHLLSISTTLGPNVGDLDCAGSLSGVQFAQTLSASSRPTGLNRGLLLAKGGVTRGDFLQWSPDLSLIPDSDGSICMTFSAQIASSRSPITSGASVRLAVSTSPLYNGLTNFAETSLSCKDITTRWYVIDSYANGATGPSSKVLDYQGNLVGEGERTPNAELSSSEARQFYVLMQSTENGVSIELGSGDGSSERDRIPIVTAVDGNLRIPIASMKRLSFSSSMTYDIAYTNIQSCSGPVVTTSSPTPLPSSGGGDVPPKNLVVAKSNRNFFFKWPMGWSKPSAIESSCIQFDVKLNRAAKLFVGLSTAVLGRVKTTSVPAGANMHVLALTRNTIQVYRNGVAVKQQYLTPVLKVPKRGALLLKLRTVATESGDITLLVNIGNTWRPMFQFTDASANFLGTQFSLASSVVRTFQNVAVCNPSDGA